MGGFMTYTVEMPSCGMIFVPSFIKIGIGAEAILWFGFKNLRDCNVGITGAINL
jgi:hypothetical protein